MHHIPIEHYLTLPYLWRQKNDDASSLSVFTLKNSLTRDNYRDYYSGTDINVFDLEKNRTTPQLISGRQLHEVAKRGVKSYRKALSFASAKWDINTDTPKESGTTADDVIEFVRCKMYKLLKTKKSEDSEEDEDDDDINTDNEDENNEDGEDVDSDDVGDDEL